MLTTARGCNRPVDCENDARSAGGGERRTACQVELDGPLLKA